jgi:uncharacterized protein (TIGR03067 family)
MSLRYIFPAVLVALLALVVLADAAEDAAKAEADKWQGTWRVVSMEHDGEKTPKEKLKPIKLTVQGNNYHFQNGEFSERGSYKFDPSQEPKALNIVVDEGKDRGKIYLVIYQVEGDKLTICLHGENKFRPTEFSGRKGSGCVLEEWERVR